MAHLILNRWLVIKDHLWECMEDCFASGMETKMKLRDNTTMRKYSGL